jgi:hypothetical protein
MLTNPPSDSEHRLAETSATPSQIARAAVQFEELPWADVGARIDGIRTTLLYVLALTGDADNLWSAESVEERFGSEYDIPVMDARVLPPEQRLAHIGLLLHSLALDYGLRVRRGADYYDDTEAEMVVDANSPAWILNLLDQASLADAAARGA